MQARTTAKAQLLCALAIVAALVALLATTPGGRTDAPRAAETATLDPAAVARAALEVQPRVARRLEALRGLEFGAIPKPEVVDSEYLNRLSAREARRTDAEQGLAADEAALRMLGLLSPDEQLESILGSTGDVAAAAYDTRADRMYVVSDAVSANRTLVEFLLAHELTHALEDQRFELREGARLNDDDAALALLALHEGTATAAMIEYAGRHLSPTELILATAGLDSGSGGVPRFYLDQTVWAYFGGARFVTDLRRAGGGWRLVDYALEERPPASTEQVLHAEKYLRAEAPLPAKVEGGTLRAADWHRAGGGSIGELSTRMVLEVGLDRARARDAAAGWGGDAFELWRRGLPAAGCAHPCREDFVLVADWRMDSASEAGELTRALGTYVEQGLGGVAGPAGAWRLDGGFAAIRAAGDEVTLVLAPAATLASTVAGDQLGR